MRLFANDDIIRQNVQTNLKYIQNNVIVLFEVGKKIESRNAQVAKTKNKRIMLLSKYEVRNSKKSKFIKEQEASGLLSSLGMKTPLSKIPLFLFCFRGY